MKKRRLLMLSIVLLCTVLLTTQVLAMSSTNYALTWYVPLSGAGGGQAASTNYTISYTVGQSAIGQASRSQYKTHLGYWYGIIRTWLIRLPIIIKGS
jgi:hypothetical protein